MDDEMRSHLEQQTRENIEAGMEPEEARYAALRSFGGMEQIKGVCREQRGVGRIATFCQAARYGLRVLRSPELLLLNWFRAKGAISSGAVEGLNNKIRVVTKRAYGFRPITMDWLSTITLASYPNPNSPTDSGDERKNPVVGLAEALRMDT